MNYQVTIGLEIHIELKTKSKMFCSCPNSPFETEPNLNICPICMGHPGTLPVINKKAVEMVIKTGLALNCEILENTYFERKNYFYPDLPKGYQISQQRAPLCRKGFLEIGDKKIGIRNIHLEEDTGKLFHQKNYSLIDFNRAGVPLMELVTEPDITSAKEARRFAEELHLIMHYLNISDADMEKGQMRIEVNISLSREKGKLGTKVEIKNLNSFRAVEKAIKYEIRRQAKILEDKGEILQETRGWDDVKGMTIPQRRKEFAQDYRYFPEPDLPPLHIDSRMLQEIKLQIPELPSQRRKRFKNEYNLSEKEIEVLVKNKELGNYFERVVSELKNWIKFKKIPKAHTPAIIKTAANYLETDLLGLIKAQTKPHTLTSVRSLKITPENFAELISILWEGEISSRIGKEVLCEMFKTGADPSHIIEERNLKQISDEKEIEEMAKRVIKENKKAVEDYKKGKENAIQFLIGQIMREAKGRANPEKARRAIKKYLLEVDQ
ncbi:Asp-tRNA(Asn)/Glu-tRNA(Gln) amidotransferase subunit GatB [bacterium]|nr:Asp-tRNA(Asn)/Glu-tRNA(Gln) amidotransferase subunit GatB [bacterium]